MPILIREIRVILRRPKLYGEIKFSAEFNVVIFFISFIVLLFVKSDALVVKCCIRGPFNVQRLSAELKTVCFSNQQSSLA